jgi:hypothetical protein
LNDIDIFIDDLDKSEKQFKYNPHLALNVFNREDDHKLPKEFQNKIAIMRSPGLIIELKELNHGNSQKIVFGILYLGTSLIASEINKKAENYYRLSEDKAHNSIFTPGQENLLNKGYYKDEKRKPMSVSDLLKQTWTPIEERVNSLLVIEDETKGKRYFELERMLKLTAEPEKEESYLLIPEAKANSKNRILQPVAVPKNSKLYITNKSAKPASLIGEMLGSGTIKISEVKEYENSFCSIELRGNDLIISNETNNDQKVIFEVIYESSTNLGNRFVALTPNIKAEKV